MDVSLFVLSYYRACECQGVKPLVNVVSPLRGLWDVLHGCDGIFGVRDVCALRSVVSDLNEAIIV